MDDSDIDSISTPGFSSIREGKKSKRKQEMEDESFSIFNLKKRKYEKEVRWKSDQIRLLHYPNQDKGSVVFSQNEGCFKFQWNRNAGSEKQGGKIKYTKMKGLLPTLRRVFWPEYTYNKSRYKGTTGVRSRTEGLIRGSTVHQQIQVYACTDRYKKSSISTLKEAPEWNFMHEYTKKALIALREWDLTPLFVEYPVGDPNSLVATSIDMICKDNKGKIVILDWKCGLDHYMMRGSHAMKGPLRKFYNDCPLNQGYLQLLFECAMLNYFRGICVKKAYLIQITMDGVIPWVVPEELIQKQDVLYSYFNTMLVGY